ncbi:hypothetical protein [Streptomyces koyangensis]
MAPIVSGLRVARLGEEPAGAQGDDAGQAGDQHLGTGVRVPGTLLGQAGGERGDQAGPHLLGRGGA